MRFSTIAITLFGAAASASATALNSNIFARQAGLPDCAMPCAAGADFDGCAISDTHCLCTSKKFVDSTTTCVLSSCTGTDLQNALSYSQGLCLAVGVTLTSSSASSTASSPASSTASSTASSASSTAPSTSGSSANSAPSNNPSSAASPMHGANTFFGLLAAGLVALTL